MTDRESGCGFSAVSLRIGSDLGPAHHSASLSRARLSDLGLHIAVMTHAIVGRVAHLRGVGTDSPPAAHPRNVRETGVGRKLLCRYGSRSLVRLGGVCARVASQAGKTDCRGIASDRNQEMVNVYLGFCFGGQHRFREDQAV